MKAYGASLTLNLIKSYERDGSYPFFPTDVYSIHVDRSPISIDIFLCIRSWDGSYLEEFVKLNTDEEVMEQNPRHDQ